MNWAQDLEGTRSDKRLETCENSMVSSVLMFYEMYEEDRIRDVFMCSMFICQKYNRRNVSLLLHFTVIYICTSIYIYPSLGLFMLIPILLDQLCTTSRLVQSLSSDFSG